MSSDLDQRENSSSSDLRSRSNSESQFKSSRAEKRMGRLFKPPSSSSSTQIKPSSTVPTPGSTTNIQQQTSTNTPSSSSQKLDKQQLQLEELKFHVARNLRSVNQQQTSQSSSQPQLQQTQQAPSFSNNSNPAQPPPPPFQQPNSESHSNSSSISSQTGSSSASSSTSTQATASSAQTTIQSQPQMTRKSSLSQFVFPKSLGDSQGHPSMLKLSTLRENAGSPRAAHHPNRSRDSSSNKNSQNIEIVDLIKISKKFKFIAKEITDVVSRIGYHNHDLNLPLHHMDTVIDQASKKVNDQEKDESLRAQLVSVLVNTMLEVKSILNHISISHLLNSSVNPESIRLVYFNLFSLLVELVSICKIIEPGYKPVSITPNSSNLYSNNTGGLKFTSSRSHNPIQLSQPPSSSSNKTRAPVPLLARASAPNPQAGNGVPIPMRQSSLSTSNVARQPLKIDTSLSGISRQDSELSAVVDLNDNTKFYDLLDYTTQCAQVVFSQLNNAIAESAIASAQKASSSTNNEQNSADQQPEANNIATMVKELTTHCVGAMEQTKRAKASLHAVRIATSVDGDQQRRLYEETSLFLKSIISILGATRKAILEIPELNEVRSALSNLTRATKELTIRLETSTLKQSVMNNVTSTANLVEQPPLSAIPSVANFQNGLPTGLQTSTQQYFFSGEGTSTPVMGSMLSSPMITSAPALPVSAIPHPSLLNSKSNLTPDTKENQLPHLTVNTSNTTSSTPETKPSSAASNSTITASYSASKPNKLYLPTLPVQTLDPNNSNILNSSSSNKNTMQVTTPLVASIGPTVASAVLPMTSPLQNNGSMASMTGNITSPSYLGMNGEREHNPFERMMSLNNQQQS